MNRRILILFSALLAVLCVVATVDVAQAQRSRRVLKRDLATQTSVKVDEPVKAKDTTGGVVDTSAAGIGWQPKPEYVTASTGVVAITGPTGATNQDQQMQMLQSLLGALSGQGQRAGTGAGTGANTGSNNGTNTGGNTGSNNGGTSPGNSADTPTGSRREDSPDPGRALPENTQVQGRKCEANTNVWQPFTPHKFQTTSCFGHRGHRHHNGLDIVIDHNPPMIMPVAPGKIHKVSYDDGGYGCQIVIEHESCPAAIGGSKCYSQYAHLKKDRNGKCPAEGRLGQSVTPCTELGHMGNTGGSRGAHLHFEVRTGPGKETAKDPITHFREWQAHNNYNAAASSCGKSMPGHRAPARQTPGQTPQNGVR